MFTDPISDFLTRIRNASLARKAAFDVPYSKLKSELAKPDGHLLFTNGEFGKDFGSLLTNKGGIK